MSTSSDKDRLIVDQALQIRSLREERREMLECFEKIRMIVYCVGGGLNDNILGYTQKQKAELREIAGLADWEEA